MLNSLITGLTTANNKRFAFKCNVWQNR